MTNLPPNPQEEALQRLIDRKPVRVVVLGDLILDRYVWGSCGRISPEAPVPVVQVQSENDCLGGSGNVVANLAGLGANVRPVSVFGADPAAERVRVLLGEMGCSTDYLVESPGRPTIEKTRVMAHNQQVVRIDREVTAPFTEDVYAKLQAHMVSALQDADVCVVSDYAKGVCQPKFLRQILDTARERGVPVLVDPKSRDFSRYMGASCITPNTPETAQVVPLESTDDAAIAEAARALRDMHQFEHVLITRGPGGMTLLSGDQVIHIPAQAREVYDVSGAGDTVIATMAAGLGAGLDYPTAAQLANTAAGIVVGKLGTAPVSLAELKHAVQTNGIQRIHTKVLSAQDLLRRVAVWRSEDKRIVFTNGCFDLLHLGHVTLLEKAGEQGDVLIVALNSDASEHRIKGSGRPINNERHRALVLAGLAVVDAIVVFDEDTPTGLIQQVRPDVLVKGANYEKEEIVGWEIVEGYGGEVVRIPLVEGHSATGLIDRIHRLHAANVKP